MSIFNRSALLGGSASSGYQISRSVRLRSSASAYFSRTNTASSRTTWTWSGWVKRGSLGSMQEIFSTYYQTGAATYGFEFRFDSGDTLTINNQNTSSGLNSIITTTQVFRDPSAWYYFVLVMDTTQATAANRIRLYVNGALVSSFSSATYPAQNDATGMVNSTTVSPLYIGATNIAGTLQRYLDGYLTEVNFIDGQALTPSSFGETDVLTGVWKPKKYTGTYGTNGFFLNFSDPSAASASAIGKDYSGNGNNWTPNNISVTAGATYDSMIDVPTPYADGGNGRGNYAVLNAASIGADATLSNGNLTIAYGGSGTRNATMATIGMSSGKWYWECTVSAGTTAPIMGITNTPSAPSVSNYPGFAANGWGYEASNGNKVNNASSVSYGSSYTTNDVVGVTFDADARELVFYKNGVSQGVAYTGLAVGEYFPAFGDGSALGTWTGQVNFGQRPFAYTPPTGFKALNTQNLPEPTIKKGGEYFNPVLWTGNNTSGRSITGVGFQPDLVWTKARSVGYDALITDAVRGAGKSLTPSSTAAEVTNNVNGYVSALNADGFTLTQGSSSIVSVNESGQTYVGWNWKAGGTPAVTNTAGSITSTVSAGVTQGFSVVTFTGTLSAATVGHGLGVAPSFIIAKRRNGVQNWVVGSTALGWTKALNLDLTDAAATTSTAWNNTAPTSSVFSVSTFFTANTFVAYCFAEVPGFSRFGSYTGNGSADGPFVFCGFRPAFVLLKNVSLADTSWIIYDNQRNGFNETEQVLNPNSSAAEATYTTTGVDMLSNGFKLRGASSWHGSSGQTVIFAAFAEHPFKNALAR